MQLSIVGCPDKKRFRPYIKRAAMFYAETLITKKQLENIFVRIKFDSRINACGYASVQEYNASGRPRQFLIEINPNMNAKDIFTTLAHEMSHVKQYVYCETNKQLTRWRGTKIEETEYWTQPWEIEAHGLESGLFTKFAIKEKLWDVFEDVSNPDDPIEKEELGWKEVEVDQRQLKLF